MSQLMAFSSALVITTFAAISLADATSDAEIDGQTEQLAQATSPELAAGEGGQLELKNNLIEAIRNHIGTADPATTGASADSSAASDELRAAIRAIVEHADANGIPNDHVVTLIEEAISASGPEVSAALRSPDGSLDTASLIRGVVDRSLAPTAADTEADYISSLKEEAGSAGTPAKAAGSDLSAEKPARRPTLIRAKHMEKIAGAEERRLWSLVSQSDNPTDYQVFLDSFPDGMYAVEARVRLADLGGQATVAAQSKPLEVEKLEGTYVVQCNANLRQAATPKSSRIGLLLGGEDVQVTGKVKGKNWFKVKLLGGEEGFVFGPLLRQDARSTAQTVTE